MSSSWQLAINANWSILTDIGYRYGSTTTFCTFRSRPTLDTFSILTGHRFFQPNDCLTSFKAVMPANSRGPARFHGSNVVHHVDLWQNYGVDQPKSRSDRGRAWFSRHEEVQKLESACSNAPKAIGINLLAIGRTRPYRQILMAWVNNGYRLTTQATASETHDLRTRLSRGT